ncbi:MAG: hypothetical protein ABSF18_04505 [Gammaproteobacteria bacterium]|jgi:hypothetical protein
MNTPLQRTRALIIEHPLAAAFMMIAVVIRIIFWLYTDRTWEDALITITPAQNFWLGYGITHHISEPQVHSFTSPFSLLIPLVGDAFGYGLTLLKLTSLIFAAGAIYYAYRIGLLLKFHWSAQVLMLSYLATDQLQIFFGMTGMETQLTTAIFLGTVYYLIQKKWGLLGLFGGLGMLARPEFVFWVPVIGLYLLIWHRKHFLSVLIPFLCITLPWYLFAFVYYGSFIPNTIVAKSFSGHSVGSFSKVLDYVLDSWRNMAPFKEWFFASEVPIPLSILAVTVASVILLSICGFIKAWQLRNKELLAISIILAIFIVYRSITQLSPYLMWYLPPFMALLFLLAAYGLSNVAIRHRYLASTLGCFIAIMYAIHIPFTFPVEKIVQEKIECDVRFKTGLILNDMMGASDTVVLEPLGYIGYGAFNKTTYDHPGLSSKVVVKTLKESHNKSIYDLIVLLQPSFIVLRPNEIQRLQTTQADTAKNYRPVAHIRAEENLSLEKWGYSSQRNKDIDGDFTIFQRITPPTELGPQKPMTTVSINSKIPKQFCYKSDH